MAIVFDCNWEDGSDEQNTGGASVWDTLVDASNRLSFDTTSAMWGTNCLKQAGQLNNSARLIEGISGTTSGWRVGYMFTAEGLASGQSELFFQILGTGTTYLLSAYLYDNAGALELFVQAYDTGGTARTIGSNIGISINTKYQILFKLQSNTAGGAAFKVYAADGTTQIGTEQTLSTDYTTRNVANHTSMVMAGISASWRTHTMYYDIVQMINTYAYPDTIVSVGITKLKTWNGLPFAKIKTINGLAIVKVKTVNGLP